MSKDYIKPEENTETMYKESGSKVAVECANVVAADGADLDPHARALYVGVTGNVTILTPRGTSVLFTGVVAGTILPCYVARLMDTGTTATDFVAFYG